MKSFRKIEQSTSHPNIGKEDFVIKGNNSPIQYRRDDIKTQNKERIYKSQYSKKDFILKSARQNREKIENEVFKGSKRFLTPHSLKNSSPEMNRGQLSTVTLREEKLRQQKKTRKIPNNIKRIIGIQDENSQYNNT
mmetsp:Transcript_17155/g.15138  ORF Transcript_17155/g.15138 Transcript_17155/m.15138 type:complete len:136 (+) Transcript_17155:428-835(+)